MPEVRIENAGTRANPTEQRTGPGRAGSAPATTPSTAKRSGRLDPDLLVWERQPGESKAAYDAFLRFRESESRTVTGLAKNARAWSGEWSWGYRAYQYDLHLERQAEEEAVRYRRQMNERHRAVGRAAINKVTQWIINVNPEDLSPQEAARLLEVASKLERMAGGEATDRVAVKHSGNVQVDQMSAEEVRDALVGIQEEIARLTENADDI